MLLAKPRQDRYTFNVVMIVLHLSAASVTGPPSLGRFPILTRISWYEVTAKWLRGSHYNDMFCIDLPKKHDLPGLLCTGGKKRRKERNNPRERRRKKREYVKYMCIYKNK